MTIHKLVQYHPTETRNLNVDAGGVGIPENKSYYLLVQRRPVKYTVIHHKSG
jgi:hypothetical protein